MENKSTLVPALVVEFLGTALLVAAQIGTGYALTGLAQFGLPQMVTFGIAIVSALALAIAITMGGPISGGHFNPAVTIALTLTNNSPEDRALPYIGAQLLGGFLAAVVANFLWAGTVVTMSVGTAPVANQLSSELLATGVLVGIVVTMVRRNGGQGLNWLVPAWVGTAIFLTPTGCMANPAVTLSHMFTASYTSAAPEAVPSYIGIQIIAALLVAGATVILAPTSAAKNASVTKK
jgi:glycerol uptake facilitator-like aquaporin